jgi:hypothetical protein
MYTAESRSVAPERVNVDQRHTGPTDQESAISARCTALFVSDLQRSDATDADALAELICRAVRRFGVRGCSGRMAQEFGDHPEAARDRMKWIRQLVGEAAARSRPPAARPATAGALRAA